MKIALEPDQSLEAGDRHAEAFKALAHLTRLRVFFLLAGAGRERYVYYTIAPEMTSELVRLLVACC